MMPTEDEWDEELADDDGEINDESSPSPAPPQARRWWSDEDDTEVLPRIQDLLPARRSTPIRRPPWMKEDFS
ncbi:hypothetical protein C5E45_29320 [Nocardia nova]|uniref:Uncharacterized protein n=1 Tax=Nocardia nova TaxID=37330 RepID=A0A2S6AHQ5_9NOCA|nr:hypothetical protein C5E41_25450 [Nocardia nova]PPJ34748.1 hypothetical protein C5E45_29320 [Nocardia nova]